MHRRSYRSWLLYRVFLLASSLMLASLCFSWQKKGKTPKPPEITILEVTCRRQSGDVSVDGKLKADGLRALKDVQLIVDFLGTGKQLLESKRGPVDVELLDPGQESEFHLRVADPIRAVQFSLRAEEGDGRELRIENTGPFPIE